MRGDQEFLAFNRGIVSSRALARTDLNKLKLAAEEMVNWMPNSLGSMSLRPGMGYTGNTHLNAKSVSIPFVFAADDTARIEITDGVMRVWVDDTLVSRVDTSDNLPFSNPFQPEYSTITFTHVLPGPVDIEVTYVLDDEWANDEPIRFTTTGTLPAGLVAGTTYYVKSVNTGANTFNVAATAGGANIQTTTAGTGTQTVYSVRDMYTWTDADESGSVSELSGTDTMSLLGSGSTYARRRNSFSVADTGVVHALRIVVERGPVTVRIGSTAGGGEYFRDSVLGTGEHSLSFTPTSTPCHVQLANNTTRPALVSSVRVEAFNADETLTLDAPWAEADLDLLRWDQSGDVIYIACPGYQQRKIERRANNSWSLTLYEPEDGPFLLANTGLTTLTPSATEGSITLTASAPLFRSTHVGALFKLTSAGQLVSDSLTGASQSTEPIRVTSTGTARAFSFIISGTFTATIRLERSISAPGDWSTVADYTTVQNTSYNDGLDNQIIYYRFTCAAYTSGTADIELTHASGSITGVARVTGYTSETVVSAVVLSALGGITATDNWAEGRWSDFRGWPSSVALDSGRLWWAGKDRFNGSVSDAYESFDPDYEGDAGPISRSVGSGPMDTIHWLASAQRLLAGTGGSIVSVRSSSLDEPLTPTNFNPKQPSTQPSAAVAAVKIDSAVAYVQRAGKRLFKLDYDIQSNDYGSSDLSLVVPEIGSPGITKLAVQRQPDTRIHCVRSDGTVAILVFDAAEDIKCWIEFETDGLVEDVCILPGPTEDLVYYTVKRTIDGSDVRFHEKWALQSDCVGGTLNQQLDAFLSITQASSTTVSGLDHLEGENVAVWQNGVCAEDTAGDVKLFTVTGGSITLDTAATQLIVGLPYTAQWKSAKLAFVTDQGRSALTNSKRIESIGVILENTSVRGLKYGRDFDNLDPLPLVVSGYGDAPDTDTVLPTWDQKAVAFPGVFSPDSRLCLQAEAPRPCTILAAVIAVHSNT